MSAFSNYRFDVTDLLDRLDVWLTCCVSEHGAVAWIAHPRNLDTGAPPRIVFYWTHRGNTKVDRLPAELGADEMLPLIKAWLAKADYGPKPDHDGDSVKGFRLYNEEWGHVDGDWSAFLAVQPVWAMYGK